MPSLMVSAGTLGVLRQGHDIGVFSGVSEHIKDCPAKVVGHAENIPVRSQVIFDVEHPEYTLKFTNLAKGVAAMVTLQTQRGQYTRAIVAIDKPLMIQDVGRNTGIVYTINDLDGPPKAGGNLKATDEKGRGTSQKGGIVTGASW